MKKVIFICLLSISMSLSLPTEQQATNTTLSSTIPPNSQSTEKTPVPASAPVVPDKITETTIKPDPAKSQNAMEKVKVTEKVNATENVSTATTKSVNETVTKLETSSVAPTTNTAEAKTTEKAPTTTPAIVPSTVKPGDKGGNNIPPASSSPTLQARAFDGPSFIGGIILTLGLLAVGFMGFKYYKKQHAENYHTL